MNGKRTDGNSTRTPSDARDKGRPDYDLWKHGLTERGWRGVVVAIIARMSRTGIIVLGSLGALCFVVAQFTHKEDNTLDSRSFVVLLVTEAMIFTLGWFGLRIEARRDNAENAEQGQGGAPEPRDRQRSPEQDGGTQR